MLWVNWGNRPDRLNLSPSVLHVYQPHGTGIGIGDPLPVRGAAVLQEGSWAAAVVDELKPETGDIRVSKYRMSGFWDTPLDSILRNLGVTTLLFAGVNTDKCVLCTLQNANFLGYDCVLIEDCAGTTSPAYCSDAAIYNVRQCIGFVTDTNALHRGISSYKWRQPSHQLPRRSRILRIDLPQFRARITARLARDRAFPSAPGSL